MIKEFWRKLKKRWNNLEEFDRYFYSMLMIIIVVLIFAGVFFQEGFGNLLKWISEAFSVPFAQEKYFQLDAQGILFLFIIFIVLLVEAIYELVKFLLRKAKKGEIKLRRRDN